MLENVPIIFFILAGMGLVGIVFVVVFVPMLLHAGNLAEAANVMFEGIGEYFDRPNLGRGCCLAFFLAIAGCCVFSVAAIALTISCFTEAPPGLCSILGR